MRKSFALAASLVLLVACEPVPEPDQDLPFVRGYRDAADQCKLVGENDFTNQFLDDAADLVACPTDMENLGVFVTDTGAQQMAVSGDYTLYSVPVR